MEPRDIFLAGVIVVAAFVLVFAYAILPDLVPAATPMQAQTVLLVRVGCYFLAAAMIIVVMARKMRTGS